MDYRLAGRAFNSLSGFDGHLSTVLSVLERFSDGAHRIVALAETEARRLGHPHIASEHLLLGIVADGGSAAARTPVASGATLDACRDKVAEAVAVPVIVSDAADLQFTDRVCIRPDYTTGPDEPWSGRRDSHSTARMNRSE